MTDPAATSGVESPPRDALGAVAHRLFRRLEGYVPTEERKGNRGNLAILRRAAGRDTAHALEAASIVLREAPATLRDADVEALFTAATLFAIHPCHGNPGGAGERVRRSERGFGASLRAIRFRTESIEEDDGVERRFVALLNCGREELPEHLRHLVTLLQSRNERTPIDYVQLCRDLRDWGGTERATQRDWAGGFWSYRASDGEAGAEPATSEDESNPED